jgi:release factor glutamine methyltransferase
VTARRAGLFATLSALLPRARFDLAVANPPFVPRRDAPHLGKTALEFERELALYGGEDGRDPIRHLLRALPPFLVPGAPFVFEFGYAQVKEVSALVEAARGFRLRAIRLDAAGIPHPAMMART